MCFIEMLWLSFFVLSTSLQSTLPGMPEAHQGKRAGVSCGAPFHSLLMTTSFTGHNSYNCCLKMLGLDQWSSTWAIPPTSGRI